MKNFSRGGWIDTIPSLTFCPMFLVTLDSQVQVLIIKVYVAVKELTVLLRCNTVLSHLLQISLFLSNPKWHTQCHTISVLLAHLILTANCKQVAKAHGQSNPTTQTIQCLLRGDSLAWPDCRMQETDPKKKDGKISS